MKCAVNWIPLRIRVRSRNTQPHLKVPTPILPLGYTKGSAIETARGAGTRMEGSIQHTPNPEGEDHAMRKEPAEEVHVKSQEK